MVSELAAALSPCKKFLALGVCGTAMALLACGCRLTPTSGADCHRLQPVEAPAPSQHPLPADPPAAAARRTLAAEHPPSAAGRHTPQVQPAKRSSGTIQQVRYEPRPAPPSDTATQPDAAASPPLDKSVDPAQTLQTRNGDVPQTVPLADLKELSADLLVAEVQARNPSLQAMWAAWQAAAQRYPQVVALDDPMFDYMAGPESWGSDMVTSAYTVQLSQKFPWFGKRQLRGEVAQAEADAMAADSEETRIQLASAAKMAFFEYFLVTRQADLNRQNLKLLQEFRDIAKTKYEANQVPQQDLLQADVELAEGNRRQIELNRMQRIAQARINTLLHLPADMPLPPPPGTLPAPVVALDQQELTSYAEHRRPELSAKASRIQMEEASLALACKEFYPDFELIARYDTFWQEPPLRTAIGFNMNIPLQQNKRRAAVWEAQAKISQRRAEWENQLDTVRYEVQSAMARLHEARLLIDLYREKILPAAEQNAASTKAAYEAGTVDFLRLVSALRQLVSLREKQAEALTDYHRALAELERALGSEVPQPKP